MPIEWYNTAILEILGGEGGEVVLANRDIHVYRFPIPCRFPTNNSNDS